MEKKEPLVSSSIIAMAAHSLAGFSYLQPSLFFFLLSRHPGLSKLCMPTLVLTYINKWADVVQIFFFFDFFICFPLLHQRLYSISIMDTVVISLYHGFYGKYLDFSLQC